MQRILKSTSNVAFVIIGEVQSVKEHLEDKIFENKVHYLGYCDDLMGVYETVDLYMNPKRNGGGYSGSMAMQAGVPVVTLPYCDVARNVGDEFVVESYDQMIDTICHCVTDAEFYQMKKKQAEINSEKNTDESMVRYIEHEMDKIIEIIEGEA